MQSGQKKSTLALLLTKSIPLWITHHVTKLTSSQNGFLDNDFNVLK